MSVGAVGLIAAYELLVPIFFVITGSHVDWRLVLDTDVLGIALAVTGLAILGKLVGCSLGGVGRGWRSAAIIGVGMAPRGEVGLIVANLGRSMGVIPPELFSTVVVMSLLTTLIVPPILAMLYRGSPRTLDTSSAEHDYAVQDGRLPDL